MKTQTPDPLLTPPSREEIMAPVHRVRIALNRYTAGLIDQAAFDRELRELTSQAIRISARIAACEHAAELTAGFAKLESAFDSTPDDPQTTENKILRCKLQKTGYFIN